LQDKDRKVPSFALGHSNSILDGHDNEAALVQRRRPRREARPARRNASCSRVGTAVHAVHVDARSLLPVRRARVREVTRCTRLA
jgi:hypothetical protein